MSIFGETFSENDERENSPTWLIEAIEQGPIKDDNLSGFTDSIEQITECYFAEVG